MATVTMNMGDYTIERDAALEERYGEEVLCAGWNPALHLARQERLSAEPAKRGDMPADLAAMDMEQFVRRMYVYLSYE